MSLPRHVPAPPLSSWCLPLGNPLPVTLDHHASIQKIAHQPVCLPPSLTRHSPFFRLVVRPPRVLPNNVSEDFERLLLPLQKVKGDSRATSIWRPCLPTEGRTAREVLRRVGNEAMSTSQEDGDELIWVRTCNTADDLMLATSDGGVVRYNVGQLRPMLRGARGVMGIKLAEGAEIVGMAVLPHQVMPVSMCSRASGSFYEQFERATQPINSRKKRFSRVARSV